MSIVSVRWGVSVGDNVFPPHTIARALLDSMLLSTGAVKSDVPLNRLQQRGLHKRYIDGSGIKSHGWCAYDQIIVAPYLLMLKSIEPKGNLPLHTQMRLRLITCSQISANACPISCSDGIVLEVRKVSGRKCHICGIYCRSDVGSA